MILGSMVPSRTVSIAFLGLLQENVSLAVIEITSYLCTFILLLHLHSSGKRNVTMLLASMLHVILTDCFVYTDMRWHAQSLVK
jgi:hypothetical protein